MVGSGQKVVKAVTTVVMVVVLLAIMLDMDEADAADEADDADDAEDADDEVSVVDWAVAREAAAVARTKTLASILAGRGRENGDVAEGERGKKYGRNSSKS